MCTHAYKIVHLKEIIAAAFALFGVSLFSATF